MRPRPIRRLHIPLDECSYVTAVFWRTTKQMQQATGEPRQTLAVTEVNENSKCVARIHLAREVLDAGTIAHEVRHAIDHYIGEYVAQITDKCVTAIHEAVEDLQ